MNSLSLIVKIIKQLKTKAAILVLITLAAESAAVYLAGLYSLPKQYQTGLTDFSKNGSYIYFDSLGQKVDIETILSEKDAVEDVLYVSFIATLKYEGEYYFLRAVSSKKCFGVPLYEQSDHFGQTPIIAGPRSVLQGSSIGEKIKAALLIGNDTIDTEFVIGNIVNDDELVMNFHIGSNAVSAYSIFSRCEKDIYVFADESLLRLLSETLGMDKSVLYPSNGIVLFTNGSNRNSRVEIINTLLANDISVQASSEIEEETRIVSKNSIDTYSAIPLLIMALSATSAFAIIVMSIDSVAKTVSLMELVGCSKARGTVLLISAFSVLLLPGAIVNAAVIFTVAVSGKQLIENVLISSESFLLLGIAVLAFLAMITVTAVFLKRQDSHVQRVVEEI